MRIFYRKLEKLEDKSVGGKVCHNQQHLMTMDTFNGKTVLNFTYGGLTHIKEGDISTIEINMLDLNMYIHAIAYFGVSSKEPIGDYTVVKILENMDSKVINAKIKSFGAIIEFDSIKSIITYTREGSPLSREYCFEEIIEGFNIFAEEHNEYSENNKLEVLVAN